MNDDCECVVFPSQKSCWSEIKDLLKELKLLSIQEPCDPYQLALHHQLIVDVYNGKDVQPGEASFEDATFHNLIVFLQYHASEEERGVFLQSTLPKIIDLALRIEEFAVESVLPISIQQQGIILWKTFFFWFVWYLLFLLLSNFIINLHSKANT
jgi:hypothetical protein